MIVFRQGLRLASVLLTGLLYSSTGSAQEDAQRLNRFNDPFFQISSAIQNCPVPAGPFITEAERLVQSHHRAELGTTCWLAHQCDRPTYYAYDQDIAKGLKAALQEHGPFDNTTLWITVQGRVVFIEGCVKDEKIYTELEALARSVPYVQQAIAAVYSNPAERPPYKLLSSP
jgi:BON domain